MSAVISLHRIKSATMKVAKFDGETGFATLDLDVADNNGGYHKVTTFWKRDLADRLERAAAVFNAAMAEPATVIAEAAE